MAEKKETFENKLNKVEEISEKLQNPDTDLNTAVELFEKGMKLAKDLDKELSKLERRVEIVTSSCDDEQIITEDYK